MGFREELAVRSGLADQMIQRELAPAADECSTLISAMNYAIQAGGKRLRPVLMAETWKLFNGEGPEIGPFMAGMEMIHTHSLIHDDLPALDNDDFRRGRETTHRKYGEAMAVLAGDALLNYAYETMLRTFDDTKHPDRIAKALRIIAEKTGYRGMLGGQSVDVENDGRPLTEEQLRYIYHKKTSALLEASAAVGAVLAGASEQEVSTIQEAACLIGLAFQIRDDILDVAGDEKELGKPVHSDEKNRKTTYVTLYGLEASAEQVKSLSAEAAALIHGLNRDSSFLEDLVAYMAERTS